MSFQVITPAFAQAAGTNTSADNVSFIFMILFFVIIFYFMILRPQNKRAKEQQALLASLHEGDEVVLAGGILGRIKKIADPFLILTIAPGIDITVQRTAVSATLPKGTIKENI